MDFRFGAAAAAAGGVAPLSGAHLAPPPFHGNRQPPQRPLHAPIPDPRSAGLAAAPPFAVPPFHGSQQPPQRPLYPPIPDSGSAGPTADSARELKKARIRDEILAREAEEDRRLEQEVRRELQLERAMAERRREVQQLGLSPPMAGAPENRFAGSVQRLGVPPPPNAGPYLLPYTPQGWGRERQGPVQSPPAQQESVQVPQCLRERHPILPGQAEGDRLLEQEVRRELERLRVQQLGLFSSMPGAPENRFAEPRVGGSVPPLLNAGPYPVPYTPQAWGRGQQGPVQAPPRKLERPESVAVPHCSGESQSLLSSSLRQDYEFFTRLGTGLLGHHPEVGVSGGPPLAAHPIGVDGQPIRPPSNSDIGASKSGEDCSGKGKEKAKVEESAKKDPPASNAVCYKCGSSGHTITSCVFSRREARARKRKLQDLEGGYKGFNGICFKCGGSGHQQKDCVSMNEGDAPSRGFDGKCLCGGSGHRLKDCLRKNGGKCFRCGKTGHLRKDCPLSEEEAHEQST